MALGFQTAGNIGLANGTNIVPDKSLQRKITPQLIKISFGDGYEQRAVNGINNLKEEYTLSFNRRSKKEIDAIIATFNFYAGVTKFDYTIPSTDSGGVSGETTIKVVCDTYSQIYEYDEFYSCTATFRRVYEA